MAGKTQRTVFDSGPSAGAMRQKNPDNFSPNLGRVRYSVDDEIFIFSTAKRDFRVSQTLFPELVLRGCTKGERYVLSAVIADPVPQASPDLERGGARMDYEDGWIATMGILHPELPASMRNDWRGAASVPSMSVGVNKLARGLFPSRLNPPLEEDIAFAESIRDRSYQALVDQAFRAAATGQKQLSDFLYEHEDVHDAMDALGLQADWHRRKEVTAKCPNCGDSISPSLAFHRSTAGVLCIIDPERAFRAGAIDKERLDQLTVSV